MTTVEFGPATIEHGRYEGYPVSGPITSTFGAWEQQRKDLGLGPHMGVDIAAAGGTVARTPADAVVMQFSRGHPSLGNNVILYHRGADRKTFEVATLYAHLQDFASGLHFAQELQRGDPVGLIDTTGLSTGNHLHWAAAHIPAGGAVANFLFSREAGAMFDPLTLVVGELSAPDPHPDGDLSPDFSPLRTYVAALISEGGKNFRVNRLPRADGFDGWTVRVRAGFKPELTG